MNLSMWLEPPWYGGRYFATPPIEHVSREDVEGALVHDCQLHLCNSLCGVRRYRRHVPPGDIPYEPRNMTGY